MSSILQDLLIDDLTLTDVRIQAQTVYDNNLIDPDYKRLPDDRSKTLGNTKSLVEFYGLVGDSIDNYEKRENVSAEKKIVFTEEDPDVGSRTETITYSLVSREPGAFSQGAPLEAKVKNMRPMLREEGVDPEFPSYRFMVLGYWYDNVVRLTCWARTNKAANARAEWIETLMEEYSWWYKAQGVDRVIFLGRRADIVTDVDNNKWYGRPIDYFVRTEKLRVFREKTIEQIIVNYTPVIE